MNHHLAWLLLGVALILLHDERARVVVGIAVAVGVVAAGMWTVTRRLPRDLSDEELERGDAKEGGP